MMACSNAKPLVTEFLLNHGTSLHHKDFESQWTALHRSIYYGYIENSLLLKRFGASFDIFDGDFLTPLQLIPNPCIYSAQSAAYVFGKNKNYNLGIGNVNSRQYPEMVKSLPPIQMASINKFHSLFLSSGKLFGCGISKEGRIGIGSENTIVNAQEIAIKFNHKHEKISSVSAGLHHSLILTQKSVYGCGSNKHFQLGLRDVERALVFTEIHFDRMEVNVTKLNTVIACDYHSIFVNSQGVYICGLNLGQFGGIQESIPFPRKLANPSQQSELKIQWAQSNNCCICVYASVKETNFLTIYYNRRVKTFKNPMMEKLTKCCISGGEMLYNSDEIVKNSSQKPLTIVLMTEHKNFYIYYEDILQFVKVHVSPLFASQIRDFMTCGDGILVEADGHLFQTTIQHKLSKMYQAESEYQEFHSKKDIAQFLCSKMSFKRIQSVSNVESFSCDVDGESFVTILSQRTIRVPAIKKEAFDFSTLLYDEFEYANSGILDVQFQVKDEIFKANKFLVSSRSTLLKNLIETSKGACMIEDNRLTPAMFKCILCWIYKNNISAEELNDVVRHTSEEKVAKKLFQDFHDIAVEWNLNGVYNEIIDHCPTLEKRFDKKVIKLFRWFTVDDFPEFYDVTILLDENQKLRAHKVVLMMRIEYFKMMFYHCWSEENVIDLRHISIHLMQPIIQFAYDNNIEAIRKANHSENFMYNMIAICDQYLIENMKTIFETMICEKINLRNCAENLEFSVTYNCHLIKKYSMEFISLNLARLLETTVLDSLDSVILKELSTFYRAFLHMETDSNYIITPAFDAPSEEEIDEIIKDFNFELYCETNQKSAKKVQKTPNNNLRSKTELTKRGYEKEGVKELQKEIREVPSDTLSPKTPENIADDSHPRTWQKKERERKDSVKKKLLTALKCNEILKNEPVALEPMIDLRSLKITSEDESPRNHVFTLADFGIKSKKKDLVEKLQRPTSESEDKEVKIGWNMSNVDLKPINQDNNSDPFKITAAATKKNQKSPKPSTSSGDKKFTSIIRNEKKEKENYEKIKSKSLVLTQIEERAITELSEFYNITKIYDEDIKISRKVHVASLNLSSWHSGAVV